MRKGMPRFRVLIVLAGVVISATIFPACASAQRRPPGADSVPGQVSGQNPPGDSRHSFP